MSWIGLSYFERHSALAYVRPGLSFDGLNEIAEGYVEGAEEAHDGVPAHATPAILDLRDVGRIDPEPSAQLVLPESGAVAQLAQCSTECDLILGGFVHLRHFTFSVKSARVLPTT